MIRLSLFLFTTALLAALVSADAKAGPDEALYMYHAYKIEFLSDPSGGKTIAVGCAGSLKDGRCNWNEFISHIINPKHKKGWDKFAKKYTEDPDAAEVRTKDRLNKDWKYMGAYDSAKLLKDVPPGGHGGVMEKLTDALQTARTKDSAGWPDEMKLLRECADRISSARDEANAKGLIPTLKESPFVKSKKIAIETRSMTSAIDGATYDAFDSEATLKGIADGDRDGFKEEVRIVSGEQEMPAGREPTKPEGKKYLSHAAVTRVATLMKSRLNGSPGC